MEAEPKITTFLKKSNQINRSQGILGLEIFYHTVIQTKQEFLSFSFPIEVNK